MTAPVKQVRELWKDCEFSDCVIAMAVFRAFSVSRHFLPFDYVWARVPQATSYLRVSATVEALSGEVAVFGMLALPLK